MTFADKLSFAKRAIGVASVRPTTFAANLPGSQPSGRVGVFKKMVAAFKPKAAPGSVQSATVAAPNQKVSVSVQSEKKPGFLKKAIGAFKHSSKSDGGVFSGIELGDLAVILAKQANVPELQAESARDRLQFEAEGQLWEFEKVGQEEKEQVVLKTGFLLSFKNLEKVQLVTILCMAQSLVKEFEGSMWVDNTTGRLEMGWRLGYLNHLSETQSVQLFEMAYAFVTTTKAQFLEEFGPSAFRKPE
jgi:hypothetical protein